MVQKEAYLTNRKAIRPHEKNINQMRAVIDIKYY